MDGEAASHSAKGDDEDQVPLSERYKRSRSSTPVAADESSSPGVAGEALGAPAVVPRPSRDGRKRLKIGLALRPMAAGARDRSAATAPSGLGASAPVPPSSAPGPDPERMSTPLSTPPEPSAGAVPASGPSASPSSSAPAMSAAPYASAECTLDKEGLSMADKAAYFDCMTQQPLFKVCERVLNEVDRYRAGRDEA